MFPFENPQNAFGFQFSSAQLNCLECDVQLEFC